MSGLEPYRLDALLELLVRVELVPRLVAGAPEVRSPHRDHGHAVVHEGARNAVDHVRTVARRQQRAAERTGGILDVDEDGRGRAGHAVDARGALVLDLALRRLDPGDRPVAGS